MGARQAALDLGRRRYGVLGAAESDEERVALRVDLVATVRAECLAQDALVICERLTVAISQLLEQLGRSLDVGEEQCDRAASAGH